MLYSMDRKFSDNRYKHDDGGFVDVRILHDDSALGQLVSQLLLSSLLHDHLDVSARQLSKPCMVSYFQWTFTHVTCNSDNFIY